MNVTSFYSGVVSSKRTIRTRAGCLGHRLRLLLGGFSIHVDPVDPFNFPSMLIIADRDCRL